MGPKGTWLVQYESREYWSRILRENNWQWEVRGAQARVVKTSRDFHHLWCSAIGVLRTDAWNLQGSESRRCSFSPSSNNNPKSWLRFKFCGRVPQPRLKIQVEFAVGINENGALARTPEAIRQSNDVRVRSASDRLAEAHPTEATVAPSCHPTWII
jgi:hypothetical protein